MVSCRWEQHEDMGVPAVRLEPWMRRANMERAKSLNPRVPGKQHPDSRGMPWLLQGSGRHPRACRLEEHYSIILLAPASQEALLDFFIFLFCSAIQKKSGLSKTESCCGETPGLEYYFSLP